MNSASIFLLLVTSLALENEIPKESLSVPTEEVAAAVGIEITPYGGYYNYYYYPPYCPPYYGPGYYGRGLSFYFGPGYPCYGFYGPYWGGRYGYYGRGYYGRGWGHGHGGHRGGHHR